MLSLNLRGCVSTYRLFPEIQHCMRLEIREEEAYIFFFGNMSLKQIS